MWVIIIGSSVSHLPRKFLDFSRRGVVRALGSVFTLVKVVSGEGGW